MSEVTEDRILDAAEQLFAERGFGGTTTRLLAQQAGVNEVTIFRLFGSKLGVLVALFMRLGADQMRREAAAGEISDDPREALMALAKREIEVSAEHGGVAMRIAFEARSVPEIGELMGEGPAKNLQALTGLFARWQESGKVRSDIDPRVLAEAFSSLTSSVVMYREVMGLDPTEGMSNEELARQLTEVLLGGVLAQGRP